MAEKTTKDLASILVRESDGTIQLTLTIPFEVVQKIRELVIKQLIEDLTIPGFRKGKAPTDIAIKHVDKQKVYEATLQNLLPEYYSRGVLEHKLNPVLAPRFELINVEEDRNWEIKAITCEIPQINLGDYKKRLKDVQASLQQSSGQAREKKEQQAIKTLLENVKIEVPKPLVEEEVNHRLSQLLDQVQRLGLSVEQYLGSTGKKIEDLRREYEVQAKDSITLVLALNKLAEVEKLEVQNKEIEEVIQASENALSQNDKNNPKHASYIAEQKRVIHSVLLRRHALDFLTNLI